VICRNLHPDHSTVARFMTRHEQPVKGLLVASLAACAREGLVSVDVVAGDGTRGNRRDHPCRGDGAWLEATGWFEQRAAQVL
jgi:hypothetical protein